MMINNHIEILRLEKYGLSNLWIEYTITVNNEEGC